jgi:UDP-N-acetylglucosamine acyltransferase
LTSSTQIHPSSIIDKRAEISDGVEIGPFCVVDGPVKLASGVKLVSHVSVAGRAEIGEGTKLYPFAAVGHPPQDFKYKGEDTKLVIGKGCTLREHVTMHPGTATDRGQTVIGDNCYFMATSHVAHDCSVGNNVVFANGVAVGGSSTIEDNVIISGLAAIHQFTRIGKHAFIGGMATVVGDVIPYGSVVGNHARLVGLNVTGLKRRGFSRETIQDMRAAYRLLFAEEGTFQERIDDVARIFAARPEVQDIISFVRFDSKRSLCMPERRDSVG